MPETFQSFFDKVNDAAAVLGDSDTINLIAAIKNLTNTANLRLLIVGSTGSGRFSVANFLLSQPELLPKSSIPKAAISLLVKFGETETAEVSTNNGVKTIIPVDELRSFLINSDTDASKYQNIEVKANSDLLKTCELRIESINARKSVGEWKEILAGTDYGILVLRATSLLSENERKFVRDILKTNFGLERFAIIINQMDLVPEDERQSVSEMVRAFLGSFESQPLLIEFSAIEANKALSSKTLLTDSEMTLSNFVKFDLLQKHSLFKSAAMHQAAEICLSEIEQVAAHQNSLIDVSELELQELLNKIDSQSKWLESRIQKSQQNIEVFINTLCKEEFFREIDGFAIALKQQLPDEIMSISDISSIKKHLSGYLEAIWTEFFDSQLVIIRGKLSKEIKQIEEKVEEDIKELVGNEVVNFQWVIGGFEPNPTNLKNLLIPRRSKNKVGSVATGLQLGGFLLLTANFPLGLAAIGSGQFIRLMGKKAAERSDKQAVISSVIDSTKELEEQIKQQVDIEFAKLTEKIKAATADLYNEGINNVRSSIHNALESHQELDLKKEEIKRLLQFTIPELKELLNQLI